MSETETTETAIAEGSEDAAMEWRWDRPPVTVDRVRAGTPAVVRIDKPGDPYPWVMRPEFAREMAALLLGAAAAVEFLDDLETP